MTREELKAHCERQIQQFERVKKILPVTPNDWQRYEEHKMVLELLELESVLEKARAEIENTMKYQYAIGEAQYAEGFEKSLEIIDKCMTKSDEEPELYCKAEASGWRDALACNDCQNKCEEWHQWDKEMMPHL